MKIILFLNNDIHSATALNLLLHELENHQVKLVVSQKVGKTDNLPDELTQMKAHEQLEVVKYFSHKTFDGGISSYVSVNGEEALRDFQNFAPDLIISIRFGQIFKAPLIKIPRLGVLNLHSGILPNYRGVMASFWAILNGEKNLGTTLHYIDDASIDTGEILAFSKSEIDWNVSLILNINNLYQAGCGLVLQALQKISINEEISKISQKSLGLGQYFSYPKQDEVRKFLEKMPLTKDADVRKILENLR